VSFAPPPDCPAQAQVGDRAGRRRQPEGDQPVGEHPEDGEAARGPERDQRSDHAALDATHTAGQRQNVSELADEVGHDDRGQGWWRAEGV
jgi:hypothetical protein